MSQANLLWGLGDTFGAAELSVVPAVRESWTHIVSPTLRGFEAHVRRHGSHLDKAHDFVAACALQRVGELVGRLARAVGARLMVWPMVCASRG
jgi:hypothetical protein